jgi:nitrate reductase gamma subunit
MTREILVNLLALIGALYLVASLGLLAVFGLAGLLARRDAREARARMATRHDRKQVEAPIRDVQGAA